MTTSPPPKICKKSLCISQSKRRSESFEMSPSARPARSSFPGPATRLLVVLGLAKKGAGPCPGPQQPLPPQQQQQEPLPPTQPPPPTTTTPLPPSSTTPPRPPQPSTTTTNITTTTTTLLTTSSTPPPPLPSQPSSHARRQWIRKDLLLLCILIITFFYMSFCLYFWLVANNDANSFNWYISTKFRIKWIPWYTVFLSLTAVVFGYFSILIILSICHIYFGHQIYIHPIHVTVISITLVTCIGFTLFLNMMWPSEWTVVKLSFQIVGPFIHFGLIFITTMLTWILVKQWYILERFGLKLLIFVAYLAVLVGVYVLPLFIDSPCIRPAGSLPQKPQMFAHRGAAGIAPENTIIAFRIAANQSVYGFESDVRISLDGIPFIMHDRSLKRTTNIDKVFPDRVYNDASTFRFDELAKLDAGSWFLEDDPMNIVSSLTDYARELYKNQTIMTLSELIQLAIKYNKYLMVDVRPPVREHPYHDTWLNRTIEVILNSGIQHDKIWWLPSDNSDFVKTLNFTQTEIKYEPVDQLYNHSTLHINVPYTELSEQEIHEYSSSNITTNIYLVNSRWFFSLYWCMGVQSVTTDNCHILSKMTRPIWHFTPTTYTLIWISADVLSIIIITIIFIVQRIRLSGTRFNPETISLHSQQTMTILTDQYHSNSRTMKEKLLFTADQLDEDMLEASIGVSNDNINNLDSPNSHFSSPQRDIIINANE